MLRPDVDIRHVAGDLLRGRDDVVTFRTSGEDLRLPEFADPFRERIRESAEARQRQRALRFEFIRNRGIRKEDRAQELLARRGDHRGLVCILSAMEPCSTYKPWHNKQSGKTYLVPNDGKCLDYYFYFVDEELGFCHVRVPTWLPCRLQVCLNGYNWLAGRLRQSGIEYRMADKRLHAHRGLAKGTGDLRWLGSKANPRAAQPTGAAVLSDPSRFRQRLPLERGPV